MKAKILVTTADGSATDVIDISEFEDWDSWCNWFAAAVAATEVFHIHDQMSGSTVFIPLDRIQTIIADKVEGGELTGSELVKKVLRS
jgi:hypothetical protein